MNLSKEELQRARHSGTVKMILGIIFLSASYVFGFIFGIAGVFLGLYTKGGAIINSVEVILFVVFAYILIGGLYIAGIPILIIGIVVRTKNSKKLKEMASAVAEKHPLGDGYAPYPISDESKSPVGEDGEVFDFTDK